MKLKKFVSGLTSAVVGAGMITLLPALTDNAYAAEVVSNDFEISYEGWHPNNDAVTLTAEDGIGYDGTRGMSVTGRTDSTQGVSSSKGFYLYGGISYDYSVKVYSESSETFRLTLRTLDRETDEETIVELDSAKAKAGEWTELSGVYAAPENSYEFELVITTDSTNDFAFDDLMITTKARGNGASAASGSKGLKDEFANYGFRVGNILNGGTVRNDAILATTLQNYNSIECENETKPDATLNKAQCSGTNIAVKLDSAAAIFDFCQKNNIAVRGHAFVWHSQTPAWFLKENFDGNANWVSSSVMDQRLESYIKNMFNAIETQYPNLNLYAYDVCNECISDDASRTSGNQDGHREAGDNNVEGGKSAWVAVYGNNSFIEKAFTYARKYAPEGCSLFYNDYNEYWDHKRDCIIRTILKPLSEKGLLDGMGMQSHVPANATGFAGTDSYLQAMQMFLDLGIQVQVTELDISLESGKYSLQDQATKYKAIFDYAKEWNKTRLNSTNRVTAVCIWGPNDANSWLKAGSDALLFDKNNQAKTAYTQLSQMIPASEWGDGTNYQYDVGGGPVTPPEPNDYGWWFQCGFEDGEQSWTDRGGNSISQSSNEHYTEWGSHSLLVSDRTSAWQGAAYSLPSNIFKGGESYSFSAHVKQNSGESVKMMMKVEYTDASGETAYDEIDSCVVPSDTWAQLHNSTYTIPEGATGVKIYVETEESLTDFYIDEVIGAVSGTGIAGEGHPSVPPAGGIVRGDTTMDGVIDSMDLVLERQVLLGKITDANIVKAADVDQSGKVESNDLVLLQQFILGKIKEFPDNRPPVDTAKYEAEFSSVSLAESWKKDGENNVLWTQRFGADPGFMVYKDRLYVFTTNDAVEYRADGSIQSNTYNSGTINCFSSADLVNWTDHGAIPVAGKNSRTQNGAAKWASFAWAPDACWKTINGKDKFFLYFADSAGGIGVLTADSPEGPYTDPIGKALINRSTPGFSDVTWLFDPAVMVDDDGTGYLYVGGGVPEGKAADPGTARAVKLGADMTSLSGEYARLNPPYLFEDSSILKVNGTYYYSYCTNWSTGGNPYGFGNAQIGVMTASNPLGPFTYKGIALKNPAEYQLDGGGNNHHSIVEFKGKYYILYHSRHQSRAMNIQATDSNGNVDLGGNYRSCHIDEATFSNGMFSASGSMKGVSQIETLNPYIKVQAETMSNQSKGISTSGLYDTTVVGKKGEWIKVSGVNFNKGTDSIKLRGKGGSVKICTGSPKGEAIGYAEFGSGMSEISVPTVSSVSGTKDVYFVFSGDTELDWWQFS